MKSLRTKSSDDSSRFHIINHQPLIHHLLTGPAKGQIHDRNTINQLSKTYLKSSSSQSFNFGLSTECTPSTSHIRKIHQTWKANKYLLRSKFSFCRLGDEIFYPFFYTLQTQRPLKSLETSILMGTDTTDRGLETFTHDLKSLKDLSSLKIKFSLHNPILTDVAFKKLKNGLRGLGKLTQIALEFVGSGSLSNNGLKYLSKGFRNMKNLRRVHLMFVSASEIEDTGAKELALAIGKLKAVVELDLNFTNCRNITSIGLCNISFGLKKLKNLTKLALMMNSCSGIVDRGLIELGFALESLKLLSVLRLDFNENSNIGDFGIQSLGKGFKKMESLCSLNLSLCHCEQIGDQGLDDLAQELKECQKLQKLVIKLRSNSNIENASLESFASLIKENKNLSHIELSFSYNPEEFIDRGVEKMCETMKDAHNIKTLKLEFMNCRKLTNKSLKALASVIKTWTSLEFLLLDFRLCKKMTGSGVKELFTDLGLVPPPKLDVNIWEIKFKAANEEEPPKVISRPTENFL